MVGGLGVACREAGVASASLWGSVPAYAAGNGEVEELLGVQLGEGGGAPLLRQVLGRAGGRVAGVVPAAEGGQHHGPLEARAPRPPEFGEFGCG